MISNYFTLAALAREWAQDLTGATIRDVYSPFKDELSIDLSYGGDTPSLRVSIRPGFHFAYSSRRSSRPRSNVTTLFDDAVGSSITSFEVHPSDRILIIRLDDGRRFEIHLYGARANVYLVSSKPEGDAIVSAFKHASDFEGDPPPAPKLLPYLDVKVELARSSDEDPTSLEKRIPRLYPRFGKVLIRELLFRAVLEGRTDADLTGPEIEKLLGEVDLLSAELENPAAQLYGDDDDELLSLVRLRHLGIEPREQFDSVDLGVRVAARRRARFGRLKTQKQPLVKALDRALARARRKTKDLDRAVSSESRADEYERWGHLLMASPQSKIEDDRIAVSNVLADGSEIEIPVKRELNVIENAERYYQKARDLRRERELLQERIKAAGADLETLESLTHSLGSIDDPAEIDRFKKSNLDALRRFVGGRSDATAPIPFRRFQVTGGFDVWVGRNARENDKLTFDHASPHDLWLHARGTAGSHVVLKVPGRTTVVGKKAKQEAAAIAAWFSAARGSGLVAVIITHRKFVSKPRGSDPGAVRVHREDVLMVEPGLPM